MTAARHTAAEHDLLGDRDVPADAYWGVHTLRAVENFPITGTPISTYPHLIDALAAVKQAAARTNHELGLLDAERRPPPSWRPAARSGGGKLHDQFVVDVIQGGAGTSTNMNANEVDRQPGAGTPRPRQGRLRRTCTPTSTSTSASPPTTSTRPPSSSRTIFARPGTARGDGRAAARPSPPRPSEFRDVLKMGRTQLQDAVPMTLGPGVLGVRRDDRRRTSSRLRGGRPADPRDQPRRHGHRHRPQRPRRLRRGGLPPPGRRSPACRWSPPPT